jgi:hypothetical protein
MAKLDRSKISATQPERFFLFGAILMATVLIAGFSLQRVMGRSSFAVPYYIHIHAVVFFGWTALYVVQNALTAPKYLSIHRKVGWLAVVWVPMMVILGTVVTVALVRRGAVPFFFIPAYFLIMNLMLLVGFSGLTTAAIVLRRQTAWHSRLMFSGMSIVMVPGFGRLLPMPLLMPYAGWAVFVAVALFPLAGAARDMRRSGKVHPAWLWGLGIIGATQVLSALASSSIVGSSFYDVVARGYPAAKIRPQQYPSLPGPADLPVPH